MLFKGVRSKLLTLIVSGELSPRLNCILVETLQRHPVEENSDLICFAMIR